MSASSICSVASIKGAETPGLVSSNRLELTCKWRLALHHIDFAFVCTTVTCYADSRGRYHTVKYPWDDHG